MTTSFINNLLNAKNLSRIPLIAEVKAFSPSYGDILQGRSHVKIAEIYNELGAACISVVTGKWFGGRMSLLEDIAKNVDLPILRKDFIVSKSELIRSRESGASAVLLTNKLLSKNIIFELCHHAKELDLTPFVEIADRDELLNLALPDECILAINNKDIFSKETEGYGFEHSLNLIADAKATNAAALVSASGINNATQAQLLIDSGYDGLLIGTSLLTAGSVREELTRYNNALCGVSRFGVL